MNTHHAAEPHVIAIREMRAQGYGLVHISQQFALSANAISEVCRGITYPDAGGPILTRAQFTTARVRLARAQRPYRATHSCWLVQQRDQAATALAMFDELIGNPAIRVAECYRYWQAQAAAEQATVDACDAEMQQRRTQKEAT